MNLFIVVRWGNDDSADKSDGDDTVFLVRAPDWSAAAALVNIALDHLPHRFVGNCANVVIEIGVDSGVCSDPSIVLGPWQMSANFGGLTQNPTWIRNHAGDEWIRGDEYLK